MDAIYSSSAIHLPSRASPGTSKVCASSPSCSLTNGTMLDYTRLGNASVAL